MAKSKSDAINPGTPLKAFGAQLYFFEEETNLTPYLKLAEAPVCKAEIYGQTIEQLLAQLAVMSQLLGSIELLRIAVFDKNNKPIPPEDELVIQNVAETVSILKDVIVEKFAPKPR
jgi:hypothetical protein